VPALDAAGHEAIPVTLPGLAEREHELPAATSTSARTLPMSPA
jgi:hypothetical protein